MKKIFTAATLLTLGILIAFACKKSTTTTPPAPTSTTANTTGSTTSTTGSTTSSTTGGTTSVPSNTLTTNFTFNGNPASNLNANGSPSAGEYLVFTYDAVNVYPQIQINFLGTAAPATGTYSITNLYPAANQCNFFFSPTTSITAKATSGLLHVVASTTPNNTTYFTNIVCTATTGTVVTTYTVTGAVKY